ncbi:MAG: hypothetical protein UX04_C0001G0136 [Microgenomates group bacterium GW2011_GWF2_45_18]|nr:MAG: hypothetical protein UW18_C0003G0094 [Microgenomates group bacterium GW2011_GWF1_44_10]KKU02365.1 MAG: hypothetical protein UX04_C0001G0136 [Microgenomates group bacterium GW2011_GWF2_45_18]OGJ41697.1 MAG: hypothetical protein A2378_02330 [Candidatus Pacebacteria bacterium RIFOXYB1_FULL_44_10]HAU99168.1 hypothetical protein [Candidatus Paceibacterota bacterium]HAX01698.1 hypothetical protein [Candidatus Paceibacterota bacterium]
MSTSQEVTPIPEHQQDFIHEILDYKQGDPIPNAVSLILSIELMKFENPILKSGNNLRIFVNTIFNLINSSEANRRSFELLFATLPFHAITELDWDSWKWITSHFQKHPIDLFFLIVHRATENEVYPSLSTSLRYIESINLGSVWKNILLSYKQKMPKKFTTAYLIEMNVNRDSLPIYFKDMFE